MEKRIEASDKVVIIEQNSDGTFSSVAYRSHGEELIPMHYKGSATHRTLVGATRWANNRIR